MSLRSRTQSSAGTETIGGLNSYKNGIMHYLKCKTEAATALLSAAQPLKLVAKWFAHSISRLGRPPSRKMS